MRTKNAAQIISQAISAKTSFISNKIEMIWVRMEYGMAKRQTKKRLQTKLIKFMGRRVYGKIKLYNSSFTFHIVKRPDVSSVVFFSPPHFKNCLELKCAVFLFISSRNERWTNDLHAFQLDDLSWFRSSYGASIVHWHFDVCVPERAYIVDITCLWLLSAMHARARARSTQFHFHFWCYNRRDLFLFCVSSHADSVFVSYALRQKSHTDDACARVRQSPKKKRRTTSDENEIVFIGAFWFCRHVSSSNDWRRFFSCFLLDPTLWTPSSPFKTYNRKIENLLLSFSALSRLSLERISSASIRF